MNREMIIDRTKKYVESQKKEGEYISGVTLKDPKKDQIIVMIELSEGHYYSRTFKLLYKESQDSYNITRLYR